MTYEPILQLPTCPIDIIGDVHGQLAPLKQLMTLLGYDQCGRHPDGRRLVFVGDPCDRGPDSPGVFELVMRAVEVGGATCLLGNHELALVEGEPKAGNAWFFGGKRDAERDRTTFGPFRRLAPARRDEILAFCEAMPVAAEHRELQIVHACWDEECVEFVRSLGRVSNTEIIRHGLARAQGYLARYGLAERFPAAKARLEKQRRRRSWKAGGPHSAAVGTLIEDLKQGEVIQQRHNPMMVLTSGYEREARTPQWLAGKWRFLERVPWWRRAKLAKPTVFGHYSRQRELVRVEDHDEHSVLFGAARDEHWLGPDRLAMCVDYRWHGNSRRPALAALRPDIGDLMFWDGRLTSRWGKRAERAGVN
ncbi:MAG: hypothetical protein FJ191_02940 [Gammaproteobacteria bacterium]|nr:hypothetical protein [Gammaproteobacteria bacterium]